MKNQWTLGLLRFQAVLMVQFWFRLPNAEYLGSYAVTGPDQIRHIHARFAPKSAAKTPPNTRMSFRVNFYEITGSKPLDSGAGG